MAAASHGKSERLREAPNAHAGAELQQRLAAIVESSDDAIIGKSLDGIIQSWNRGAQRMFGYTAEEVIGKHISMLAAPDRVNEVPEILARIARGEHVENYKTKRRTKDGRILTVSLTVSPILDASGVIVGASKIARDITAIEAQRQALENANAALIQSNLDLQQFAYSASHDLREPLRMVSAYAAMLKKKFGADWGAAGDEYVGYIIDGASRMQRLIDDLLAFTRAAAIEQNEPGELDAQVVLDRALKNLSSAIQESNAAITHTELPVVRMHEFQLQQVFENLIGNAIRFRSEQPPRITVSAERVGDEWVFCVDDNGIGIDPQYKEQVFGIFKRLHTAAEYPGTGMGLAICQRILQRAGGRIWVESEFGRGSRFCFTVPVPRRL